MFVERVDNVYYNAFWRLIGTHCNDHILAPFSLHQANRILLVTRIDASLLFDHSVFEKFPDFLQISDN